MATVSEDAELTCRAAPVQIQGRLRDGRWFYFRSRHEHASLGASFDGPDGAVEESMCAEGWGVVVHRDLTHLGPSMAGFIAIPDAFALLREMAADLPDAEPSTTEGTTAP